MKQLFVIKIGNSQPPSAPTSISSCKVSLATRCCAGGCQCFIFLWKRHLCRNPMLTWKSTLVSSTTYIREITPRNKSDSTRTPLFSLRSQIPVLDTCCQNNWHKHKHLRGSTLFVNCNPMRYFLPALQKESPQTSGLDFVTAVITIRARCPQVRKALPNASMESRTVVTRDKVTRRIFVPVWEK